MNPAFADLGPIVLQCRPLPPMRWVVAQGLGILGAYLAMPLAIIPFFSLWPALGALYLVEEGPRWLQLFCFGLTFVACYVILFWLVYLQPRGDFLTVCKNGFELKITFKRRTVLFEELKSISFGLQSKSFKALHSVLGLVKPFQASMLAEIAGAAMNLHYRDGSKTTFKRFLHRFEPDDLVEFLNYLVEHHTALFQAAGD